jgi:hypothetical protein
VRDFEVMKHGGYGLFGVQEVFIADGVVGFEVGGPGLAYFFGGVPVSDLFAQLIGTGEHVEVAISQKKVFFIGEMRV